MDTVKTAQKQRKIVGKPYPKGVSGNPNGRPKGTLNFSTVFEKALGKLSKSKDGDITDLEEKLVLAGFKRAMAGDYRYWNSIMDRRFGKDTKKQEQEEQKPQEERMILLFTDEELKDVKEGKKIYVDGKVIDAPKE
jgi:hypothetical protein